MQTAQSFIRQSPPALTVSQLTTAIKHSLETTFPNIWLQGEVSNLKVQSSGHIYFSMKDTGAQIAAVMFRGSAIGLKSFPKDGEQVLVQGEINVYPPNGRYQIVVREIRLVGIGELLQKLEELKAKLYAKGRFNPEHKKPLPKFPRRIGVVTSPTGAAIHDILNVLTRRFSGFRLLLNPVRVQGEGAAQEIAQAIAFFNQYQLVDVLIVGRGGGSIEDLWAFNEEVVAEAIFASKIPIISAVGHETDVCLSDFVADVRAPTPSAAAMMVIAEKEHQLQHLGQLKRQMLHTIQRMIRHDRQKLVGIMRHPMLSSPYGLVGSWIQRADDLRQNIELAMRQSLLRQRNHLMALYRQLQLLRPTTRITQCRQRLQNLSKSLASTITSKIASLQNALNTTDMRLISSWRSGQHKRRHYFSAEGLRRQIDLAIKHMIILRLEQLRNISMNLESMNPKNVLKRGFSILFNEKKDSVITSVKSIQPNQQVRLLLADGELLTTIDKVFEL